MEIIKTVEDKTLNIALEGRLDTTTAPQLETELKESLEGIEQLVIDLKDLDYISSAGLRVLLFAQKTMNSNVTIKNVKEEIMEVFEITGFSDILTILEILISVVVGFYLAHWYSVRDTQHRARTTISRCFQIYRWIVNSSSMEF